MAMTDESWRDWKLEHSGLTWTVALPEDLPEIEAIIGTTEAKYGAQDRPDLFSVPVVITLVCRDADGSIVDGIYVEAIAEIVKFGTNRAAFSAYDALLPHIGGLLANRGFRIAQIATLRRWAGVMAFPMKILGFERSDGRLAYWMRKIRP
jgi:hypothetical protein